VELEIRHRHLAGQNECNGASEEAKEEHGAPERLEDAANPDLGHQLGGAAIRGHPDRKCKELHRPGQYEHESSHDAEYALQARGQGWPLRDKIRCDHDASL